MNKSLILFLFVFANTALASISHGKYEQSEYYKLCIDKTGKDICPFQLGQFDFGKLQILPNVIKKPKCKYGVDIVYADKCKSKYEFNRKPIIPLLSWPNSSRPSLQRITHQPNNYWYPI